MRSWKLQGADKMSGPWTTLRRHDCDSALSQASFATASWSVDIQQPRNTELWGEGGRHWVRLPGRAKLPIFCVP